MKRWQISCAEEPQIIYVDSALKKVECYFPFLRYELHAVTSFQRKRGRTVEKPDKHYLSQVIKFSTDSDKPCHSIYLGNDAIKVAFYLCGLKTHKPRPVMPVMGKTRGKSQPWENLQNVWPELLKTVKLQQEHDEKSMRSDKVKKSLRRHNN